MTLGSVQVRVLGALIEKEITTPEAYPLSLNALVNAFLKSNEGQAQFRKLGIAPLGGTPESLQAHLDHERAKWGPIIQEANITLQ